MKKRPFTSSFDELIKNRYGVSSSEASADIASSGDKLFASYYGASVESAAPREKYGQTKPAASLSLSYDDGETLRQEQNGERFEEYVVQSSIPDEQFEEYVVGPRALPVESSLSLESSVGEKLAAIPADDVDPTRECQVDIFPPPKKSNIPGSKAAPITPSSTDTARPQERPADKMPFDSFDAQSSFSDEGESAAKPSDDDFIADMQSILSGQMVYDPNQKKTVKKDELGQQSSGQNGGGNEPPVPDAKNSQAIFDRIAQSMQYANAYDLGTLELENRFSDFDKISEREERAAREKKAKPRAKSTAPAAPVAVEAPPVPSVDSTDFIRDLDAIRQKSSGPSASAPPVAAVVSPMSLLAGNERHNPDAACIPLALSLSSATSPSEYSRPLYDTGEHVRAGWDLFTDQLRVGQRPGVLFSYGELISMGDIYQSVSQMMGAEVNELQQIKTLIRQSTDHFTGKRAEDVSEKEWQEATNKRFLDLAEENYHHFAPDVLFNQTVWAKNVGKRFNNKSIWERHHQWAIEEAQKMYQLPENSNRSFFLEWPLIINAFGDHFLTDAFSAGHVANKEAIIEYYKYNFYDGNSLKPEAEKFFDRVANLAFKDDVKRKFSMLQTHKTYLLAWKPHIDSASTFRDLLIEIAKQKPDQIGNLAIKALHDRLNKDGIEVYNEAGDGTWTLTGDGTLNDFNLRIIQRAVQQSVDNINDPAINAPGLNLQEQFAKVWKHVPKLTDASIQKVKMLAKDYTSPDSEVLIKAAADLIAKKTDILIEKLIAAEKLEYDPKLVPAK